jgi:hypothetical protein
MTTMGLRSISSANNEDEKIFKHKAKRIIFFIVFLNNHATPHEINE